MPTPSSNLTKHTVFLHRGDMAFLRQHFESLGASYIIRKLVRNLVEQLDRPVPSEQVQELLAEEDRADGDAAVATD